MRALLLGLCAGCLSVPPPPEAEDDVTAGPCVPGSQLDLAYVSEIEVGPDAAGDLLLTGLALVINPGIDTLIVSGARFAEPTSEDHGVSADVAFDGSAGLVLHPGEAKGALGAGAAEVVLAEVNEEWTDPSSPTLDATFHFPATAIGPGDPTIRFTLVFGDFEFPIEVRLVDGGPLGRVAATASPRHARRTSAVCQ